MRSVPRCFPETTIVFISDDDNDRHHCKNDNDRIHKRHDNYRYLEPDMQIRRSEELGAVILSARRAQGLNQAELAKRLGVSRVWLGQVERGKASLRLDLVLRVLNELQITLTVSSGNLAIPAVLPVGDHSTDIDDIADMGLKAPATAGPATKSRRRT